MIFAELLALLALAGGGAFAVAGLARQSAFSRMREAKMQEDLRTALRAKDHRQLDDWLMLYSEHASKAAKEHVKQRRDELFIESNT